LGEREGERRPVPTDYRCHWIGWCLGPRGGVTKVERKREREQRGAEVEKVLHGGPPGRGAERPCAWWPAGRPAIRGGLRLSVLVNRDDPTGFLAGGGLSLGSSTSPDGTRGRFRVGRPGIMPLMHVARPACREAPPSPIRRPLRLVP